MYNIILMHVFHSFNYFRKDFLDLILVTYPLLRQLPYVLEQIVAVDVLYNYRDFVTRINSVIELHNSDMIESIESVDLCPKSLNPTHVLK
jgi:hypothetical protein